jgi:hypothetical protein
MREIVSADWRQIFAECCGLYGKPDAKGYCGYWGMYGWMSDEVEESDGVMYSVDEARWK